MAAAKAVLWLASLTLMAIGAVGLVAPHTMVGMSGIQATSAEAVSEARVVFGMLHVLLGAFFGSVALGRSQTPVDSALLVLAVLFGGMGVGRATVATLDGAWTTFHVLGLIFDGVFAVLALWARSRAGPAAQEASGSRIT